PRLQSKMSASMKIMFSHISQLNHHLRKQYASNKLLSISRNYAFWSRKKKENVDEIIETRGHNTQEDGPNVDNAVQTLTRKTSVKTTHGYTPPSDVEQRVNTIATDVFGGDMTHNTVIGDQSKKVKLLTKCIDAFEHDIPNYELNQLITLSDVVKYFNTEIRDTTKYDELANLDLPKNLYIQKDYIRFTEETKGFFKDGKTAFPGRDTIVTGLKYKKMYKGYKDTKYRFEE
ncbi:unnamed protein product, partial [Owenia fusiformis]